MKKGGVYPAQAPSGQWGAGQGQEQDEMGRCRFKHSSIPGWRNELGNAPPLSGLSVLSYRMENDNSGWQRLAACCGPGSARPSNPHSGAERSSANSSLSVRLDFVPLKRRDVCSLPPGLRGLIKVMPGECLAQSLTQRTVQNEPHHPPLHRAKSWYSWFHPSNAVQVQALPTTPAVPECLPSFLSELR